jgi:hypothetical protein
MARAVQVCYKVFLLLLGDPVFFMLHANVDRLWDDWQTLPGNARKYGGSVNDALSVSISTVAYYGTQEVQDMFSIRDWCYSYSNSVSPARGSDEDKTPTVSVPEVGPSDPDTASTQEPKPDPKRPNSTDTLAAITIDTPIDNTKTNHTDLEVKPDAAFASKTNHTTDAKSVEDAEQENGAIRVGCITVLVVSFIILL